MFAIDEVVGNETSTVMRDIQTPVLLLNQP